MYKPLVSIGDNAFKGCSNLSEIFIYFDTPPTLGTGTFDNCSVDLVIYVPYTSLETYKKDNTWLPYKDRLRPLYLASEIIKTNPNFPCSEPGSTHSPTYWGNENGAVAVYEKYIDEDNGSEFAYLCFYHDDLAFSDIDNETILNKKDNGNFDYTVVDDACVEFVMENGKVVKLVLSDIDDIYPGDGYGVFDGTYTPITTVANILDTIDGDFPRSLDDETVPEDAWSTSDAYKIYYSSNKSELIIKNMLFTIDPILAVEKDGDGNYNASFTVQTLQDPTQYNIKFTMDNNKLQKIEIISTTTTYCFEPVGDRLSIAKLLETYRSDFPNTAENGWAKSDGGTSKIYKGTKSNVDCLCFSDEPNAYIWLDFLLTPSASGKNYTYEHPKYSLKFVLNDYNKLQSIEYVAPTIYQNLSGTYIAPVTVADLLDTTSGSGWVKDDENEKYVKVNNNMLNFSFNVPLETVLQKDGDNYKYVNNPGGCTFVMTSGILTSIIVFNCIMSSYNGEYVPYQYTNLPISVPVGYSGVLEFITNGKYVDDATTHVDVYINDVPLDSDKYEITSASTHIKLKGSYVSTLQVGTYKLRIEMSGYLPITTEFTITGSNPGPGPRHVVLDTGVE